MGYRHPAGAGSSRSVENPPVPESLERDDMRVLHTSDWHLGASLHGRKRTDESQKFLDWLAATITREKIDLLIVAGDVFDSSSPGSRAQEMYYQFLGSAARSGCGSVVVVAGNHDSPSLIAAPSEILRFLNIHVIGSVPKTRDDLVLPVTGREDHGRVIVCAVPFLREKDILPPLSAQTGESRSTLLSQGIVEYYQGLGAEAVEKRDAIDRSVPIIATGHLFAAGCETTGDGVRECYVGNSAKVGADAFPSCFSYVALGHLHVPQVVAGNGTIRYSGSPVPIGFSEIGHDKTVIIIETGEGVPVRVAELAVPRFQRFASLKGTKEEIEREVAALRQDGSPVLAEVMVETLLPAAALLNWLATLTKDTCIECLKISGRPPGGGPIAPSASGESLADLSVEEVFRRRLAGVDLSVEERENVCLAFEEILLEYRQEDRADR
jgi:DNA repair protein SbcD/Mre11